MKVEDIRALYAYNRWANHRVFQTLRSLNNDDFVRDLGTSHSSIRGTLVHIVWAEWLWLQRWRGESPKRRFSPEEFSTAAEVETSWHTVEEEQQKYLDSLTNDDLQTRVSYENLAGERWEYTRAAMMQHVVNHSSYHRGQIATLLRQVGKAAQPTDFLVFLDETG